jgi:hypothetical protein
VLMLVVYLYCIYTILIATHTCGFRGVLGERATSHLPVEFLFEDPLLVTCSDGLFMRQSVM